MNEIELQHGEFLISKEHNSEVEYLYMDENGDMLVKVGTNDEIYMMELYMPSGTPKKLEKYILNVADKAKAKTLVWAVRPEKIKYSRYVKARFSDLPSVYGSCCIILSGEVIGVIP